MGDSGGSEPLLWTYHQDRLGVRVELVDEALRPVMQAGWDKRGGLITVEHEAYLSSAPASIGSVTPVM